MTSDDEKAAPSHRTPWRCRWFGHRWEYERGDAMMAYLRCVRCAAHDSQPISFVVPAEGGESQQ